MRKGASIVKNNLVKKFVEEHGSISSFDLSNKINLMYGISPDISRKTIEDLGYYMSFGTEEIYLTKEMYKKKVREFLDE